MWGLSLQVAAQERRKPDVEEAFNAFESGERSGLSQRKNVQWTAEGTEAVAEEKKKEKRVSAFFLVLIGFWEFSLTLQQTMTQRFNDVLAWFRNLFPESLKAPAIPAQLPPQYRKPFVLVMDLEVLLATSYETGLGWRTKKRPGVDYFLALAGQVCEIIVFSNQINPSVGWTMVPRLDTTGAISYKFFDDTKKDVAALSRPLERVLIVTDDSKEYAGLEANIVLLPKWTGREETDTSLLELSAFLEDLNRNQTKIADTRKVLRNLNATGKSVVEAYREVTKAKLEKKEDMLAGKRVGFMQ